jgi:hypothetical protein
MAKEPKKAGGEKAAQAEVPMYKRGWKAREQIAMERVSARKNRADIQRQRAALVAQVDAERRAAESGEEVIDVPAMPLKAIEPVTPPAVEPVAAEPAAAEPVAVEPVAEPVEAPAEAPPKSKKG